MDQRTAVVLVGIALALSGAILAWLYLSRRRSKLLRQRFGPEYDRVVRQEGNVRRGESVFEFRETKRETLHIQPLSRATRSDFSNRWNAVQAQFVDDPEGALAQADSLVREVMEARGYPVVDFAERAEIISVDHPMVVESYRASQAIAMSRNHEQATTARLWSTTVPCLTSSFATHYPKERKSAHDRAIQKRRS